MKKDKKKLPNGIPEENIYDIRKRYRQARFNS